MYVCVIFEVFVRKVADSIIRYPKLADVVDHAAALERLIYDISLP